MASLRVVSAIAVAFLAASLLVARLDFSELLVTAQDFVDLKTYEWFIDDCRSPEHQSDEVENLVAIPGEVHVVYAAEANGFQGLFASMLSLSRHLEAPGQCVIHIIVRGIDVDEAGRLVQCLQVELDELSALPDFKIHEVKPMPLMNLTYFKEIWADVWPFGARFLTSLSFVQVYLPEILPSAPRVVYLSSDTIVKADVARLYRTPMKSAVAAATDAKCVTWRSEYLREADELDPTLLKDIADIDARTLNNGVVVFDLDRWRKERLTQKLEYWVLRAAGVKTSRLALNLEFREHFDILDWRWNVVGLMMVPPRRCIDEARILHWDGNVKPWSNDVRPSLRSLFDELTGPFVQTLQCKWKDDVPMLDTDIDISAL